VTPSAVCFDATGTLIETAETVGEVYRRVALEHGVDLPAWILDDAFRRILRSAPARGTSGATPDARRRIEFEWWCERIRQTFQATDSTVRFDDLPALTKDLFDVYRSPSAWRIREGALEMLDALHDRGDRLCVVSNFDHRLPEILKGLDIHRFFEVISLPSDCGAEKPDRAIFERATKALGRPLEDLLYVGDDAPEVLGAIAELGLHVFDVREIRDLQSLPDLVMTAATLPRRT
jgi:putative hydrolase of the HAD superfamily